MQSKRPDAAWLQQAGFKQQVSVIPDSRPIWEHPCGLSVYGLGSESESWVLCRTHDEGNPALETFESWTCPWTTPTRKTISTLLKALDYGV